MGSLKQLPRLQKLHIVLLESEIRDQLLCNFCERLKRLHLEEVPSLRRLSIETSRWCENEGADFSPSFKTWDELETAVDVMRGLRDWEGRVLVKLLGSVSMRVGVGVLKKISRKCVSSGAYTKPVSSELQDLSLF